MNLVNKDQLDILATLRESVNEDKAVLESEVSRLHDQIKDLSDKNKMQLEQINGLLLEKVNMQSEGLDQRDRMLQRERDIGYATFQYFRDMKLILTQILLYRELRASLSGKDIPEDVRNRMLKMHEEHVLLQEQYKTVQEKLNKARQVTPLLNCYETLLTFFLVHQTTRQVVQGRAGEERNLPRRIRRERGWLQGQDLGGGLCSFAGKSHSPSCRGFENVIDEDLSESLSI